MRYYENELPDSATLSERLHWYAANYMVMMERAKRWDFLNARQHSRIQELGDRNEQLVEQVAVLLADNNRMYAAMKAAGVKCDSGDEA